MTSWMTRMKGPSSIEPLFDYSKPLDLAPILLTFKWLVHTILFCAYVLTPKHTEVQKLDDV